MVRGVSASIVGSTPGAQSYMTRRISRPRLRIASTAASVWLMEPRRPFVTRTTG